MKAALLLLAAPAMALGQASVGRGVRDDGAVGLEVEPVHGERDGDGGNHSHRDGESVGAHLMQRDNREKHVQIDVRHDLRERHRRARDPVHRGAADVAQGFDAKGHRAL